MSTKHTPSAFHYQPSSPLETLVRRTSAKRANDLAVKTQSPSPTSSPQYSHPENYSQNTNHYHDGLDTPTRPPHGRLVAGPPSPLLHSHFARDSVITTESANASSYLDLSTDERARDSVDSRNVFHEGLGYNYEESVYSTDTALRDSWQSSGTAQQSPTSGTLRHLSQGARPEQGQSSHSKSLEPQQFYHDSTAVPTVVVTEHEYLDSEPPADSIQLKHAAKAPIVQPLTHNFSRPIIRPSAVPVLMPAEEEKRKVMERNANRKPRQPGQSQESPYTPTSNFTHLPSPHSLTSPGDYFESHSAMGSYSEYQSQPHHCSQSPQHTHSSPPQPSAPRTPQRYNSNTPTPSSQDYYQRQPQHYPSHSPTQSNQFNQSIPYPYPSPLSSRPTSPTAYPYSTSPDHEQSHHRSTSREISSSPTPSHQSHKSHSDSPIISTPSTLSHRPSKVVLPRRPPSLRPDSPASLYSRYSFYQLDSPSPNGSTHFQLGPESEKQQRSPTSPLSSSMQAQLQIAGAEPPESKAVHFLQLGIQHHEANRLKESAVCFEKSAKEDGGCGAGMLMFGLTLRHGWGCEKNEKVAFKWLRKAAENAVADLESARNGGGIDQGAVRAELILAIYEVGQCFFHGWGVPKDQKMAVSYYRVAARLGDADAQNDLGFCLANGKGCKKDRKEAAKWYRAAVEQGQSDVGLAWIYKEKFQ